MVSPTRLIKKFRSPFFGVGVNPVSLYFPMTDPSRLVLVYIRRLVPVRSSRRRWSAGRTQWDRPSRPPPPVPTGRNKHPNPHPTSFVTFVFSGAPTLSASPRPSMPVRGSPTRRPGFLILSGTQTCPSSETRRESEKERKGTGGRGGWVLLE